MTWDEIRAVAEFTTIGAHTHRHPLLSQVDEARIDTEVRTCREWLTAELGEAPEYFAYPSGMFTSSAKRILRQYGFHTAFSMVPGINTASTDWMEVARLNGPASARQLPTRLLPVARR
jgi:peptidoglycan/xylan/chitin deacetylase (PgdA/CDA1 family)